MIEKHNFIPLAIDRPSSLSTPSIEKSASEAHVPDSISHRPSAQSFATAQDLLDYATTNWLENYVTTSIHSAATVESLRLRPFFILIHIDAPVSLRWQRFKDRCAAASLTPPTLEQFVLRNDDHLYSPATSLASLASRAQIQLLNTSPSLPALHADLDTLNLTNEERLRPSWDTYFMTLASLAARRSNCMRRQVGCVLVRSKRVISTGYNGTPRHLPNCSDGGCPRCNSLTAAAGGAGLSTCLCIHAEENALLEAGRERVGANGSVLYCTTCPCLTCSIKIVQVGVEEVVFGRSYYMDAQAAELFRKAGVRFRQYRGVEEGMVVLSGDLTDGVADDEKVGVKKLSLTNGDDTTVEGATSNGH